MKDVIPYIESHYAVQADHEHLVQMGIPHVWHVDSGGHTWPVWTNDLYLIANLLFKDKKN